MSPTPPNPLAPLACRQHDHNRCINAAIDVARSRCLASGVRLTSLREQVLRLIWQSHKPLGAYALMDMLAAEATRRVAPPTVYRALDFLLEQQLIHRIHSLNAFIGCAHPDGGHANNFLICQACGVAVEFSNQHIDSAVAETAAESGFAITTQAIELAGLCSQCREQQHV